MKKNALVQLIVIYFGISSIYIGISYIMPDISAAFAHIFGEGSGRNYFEITYILSFILFILSGFIIIIKSGDISTYISERSALDDSLKIYTRSSSLLSIFIVILALGHLLDYVPKLVRDLYLIFIGSTHSGSLPYAGEQGTPQLFNNILNILFPCLMIIFCRPLTAYFSKNIIPGEDDTEDDIIVEHETVTIETMDNSEQV
jgi:hypothetical protein